MRLIEYLSDLTGIDRSIKVINLPITDNCNSRCTMCNIWKNKAKNEITPEELSYILLDQSYQSVKHLGISGGEPSLRRDLVRCIQAIVDALPSLRTLSVTTHGYNSTRWNRFLPAISAITKRKNVRFSLNISLDGFGTKHSEIRGIDNAFQKTKRTIDLAAAAGIPTQIQYTISSGNAYSMQLALEYAQSINIEIIYRIATTVERLYNADRTQTFLKDDEKSFVADFFMSPQLHQQTRSLARKLYYWRMSDFLRGKIGSRPMPCYFKNRGVLITSAPSAFPCSVTTHPVQVDLRESNYKISSSALQSARAKTNEDFCDKCIHDQSGTWGPTAIIQYLATTSPVLRFIFKSSTLGYNLLRLLKPYSRLNARSSNRRMSEELESVTLIGAYGGEHVGDAAILGGVILRLMSRYKSKRFVILSLRPDRTRKWVKSLHINNAFIEVVELHRSNLIDVIRCSDGLVYAGGPIMDTPINLSFYVYLAHLARMEGKPFIAEGVGLGPYKRAVSRYLAGKLLSLADRITLRSEKNLEALPFREGFTLMKTRQDPAFDYLDHISEHLSKIPLDQRETSELLKLDDYIGNRKNTLFINLRPIWSAYIARNSELTSAQTVNTFNHAIAELINQLQDDWAVVFCPFNPDTYGFSDFSSFYGVIQYISADRDYYVIEFEPGVPLMVAMLNRATKMIAMRFHACIFALRSGVDVFGIDYQIGGKGKVHDLYNQLNNRNVQNICDVDFGRVHGWLNGGVGSDNR